MANSDYVNEQRREYSLYVMQNRAIPHAADGLKAAARRVLWIGRDGAKHKSATLAGATMPLHPHAAPEGAINTMAAPYGNNVPLLKADGAFGTILAPASYGASRYTSVSVSKFTKDVVFRDIEVIPVQENYDGSLMEPKHFLPLVPIVLLNPSEGIAVGFATNILPRDLVSIIKSQIEYLEKGQIKTEPLPAFTPTDQFASDWTQDDKTGNVRYTFKGVYEKTSTTSLNITGLPYGTLHEKYLDKLYKLAEEGSIQDITDNSRDTVNIALKFKKGVLSKMDEEATLKYLSLINNVSENMNVIDFSGERVWSTTYSEVVEKFTEWRLGWYVQRFQRLAENLDIDIQRYKDVLQAIRKNVGGLAKKIGSRSELKEYLEAINIVHIDYIADLPVYRFTEEERKKVELKLAAANALLKEYKALLRSKDKRTDVYLEELKEILANYRKGAYSTA